MEKQHCDRLLCCAGNIFCINTNIFHVSHHQLSLCEFVTVIVCMWCCETASPHSILLNTDWMSQFYRMTHMTHTNSDHHPLASNPLRPEQISAQISHNSSNCHPCINPYEYWWLVFISLWYEHSPHCWEN